MQGSGGIHVDFREQCGPDVDPAGICREDRFPQATATSAGASAGIKRPGTINAPATSRNVFSKQSIGESQIKEIHMNFKPRKEV